MISISALGTSGPGKVPHSPRMGCASLDGLAQGQDQIQHIVTGRYSDAALKNYALIPVTTVVVTMMVVGGDWHSNDGGDSSHSDDGSNDGHRDWGSCPPVDILAVWVVHFEPWQT